MPSVREFRNRSRSAAGAPSPLGRESTMSCAEYLRLAPANAGDHLQVTQSSSEHRQSNPPPQSSGGTELVRAHDNSLTCGLTPRSYPPSSAYQPQLDFFLNRISALPNRARLRAYRMTRSKPLQGHIGRNARAANISTVSMTIARSGSMASASRRSRNIRRFRTARE
jgi:hypothetical protein